MTGHILTVSRAARLAHESPLTGLFTIAAKGPRAPGGRPGLRSGRPPFGGLQSLSRRRPALGDGLDPHPVAIRAGRVAHAVPAPPTAVALRNVARSNRQDNESGPAQVWNLPAFRCPRRGGAPNSARRPEGERGLDEVEAVVGLDALLRAGAVDAEHAPEGEAVGTHPRGRASGCDAGAAARRDRRGAATRSPARGSGPAARSPRSRARRDRRRRRRRPCGR